LVTVAAGQVVGRERQLALVEQLQRLAGPVDRTDAVVAGVVDVGGHPAILRRPMWERRKPRRASLKPPRNRMPARRRSGPCRASPSAGGPRPAPPRRTAAGRAR